MTEGIEKGLLGLLLTIDAVTALTDRVRIARLRQDDPLPAVVVDLESEEHLNGLDGLGGQRKAEVTIACFGRTRQEARELAEAVRTNNTNPGTGLAGYSGVAGDQWINSAVLNEGVSGLFPLDDASDRADHTHDLLFTIFYDEST